MKPGFILRPGAAEFPHENPLINRGVLWVGSAMCSVPPASTFIIPPPIEPPSTSAAPGATTPTGVPDALLGPTAHDERIDTFVRAIADVARAHGAAESAAHAESLFKFGTPAPLALSPDARAALLDGNILEATDGGVHATAWFASTSSAWQRMLRGEEGNLAVCGESTLDGWTADLIARLVAKPAMASTIRRDLRRRGIAAFGMLEA
jgi:hypothetical protein